VPGPYPYLDAPPALCGERNRRLVERLKAEEETTRRQEAQRLHRREHPRIGFLAIQGDYAAHAEALAEVGAEPCEVRKPTVKNFSVIKEAELEFGNFGHRACLRCFSATIICASACRLCNIIRPFPNANSSPLCADCEVRPGLSVTEMNNMTSNKTPLEVAMSPELNQTHLICWLAWGT
jgi:hypothetical protein